MGDNEVFDIRDTNEITRAAKDLKQNYDRLHRLATNQPVENQFGEPKVAGLWRLALTAKFEPTELESLRQELVHYERRLEKMRFLEAELRLVDRRLGKHTEEVAKLRESLESKNLARHNEL